MNSTRPDQGANGWAVAVRFTEDDDHTVALITLTAGTRTFTARGSARRNPIDPNVPRVGEDLATARALSQLSHELISDAVRQLEAATHAPAGIHL